MNPLTKWLGYWRPILRGRFCLQAQGDRYDFTSINAGTALTGGRFWQRILGGYELYRRDPVRQTPWQWVGRADGSATEIGNMPIFPPPADRASEFRIDVVGAGGVASSDRAVRQLVTVDHNGTLVPTAPNPVFGLRVEANGADAIRLTWLYDEEGQRGKPAAFEIYSDIGSPGSVDYDLVIASIPYRLRRGWFSTALSGIDVNVRIGWQVRVRGSDGALSGPSDTAFATIHSDQLSSDKPLALRLY